MYIFVIIIERFYKKGFTKVLGGLEAFYYHFQVSPCNNLHPQIDSIKKNVRKKRNFEPFVLLNLNAVDCKKAHQFVTIAIK